MICSQQLLISGTPPPPPTVQSSVHREFVVGATCGWQRHRRLLNVRYMEARKQVPLQATWMGKMGCWRPEMGLRKVPDETMFL